LGAAAALLPDLDIESSTVSNSLGPVTRLISRVVALVSGGHREGTHSLAALAFVAFLAGDPMVPAPYAVAGVVGYVAHMVGDYFTGPGISLLWPFVRRRFGLPILGHTGGWREHATVGAVVAGTIGLLVSLTQWLAPQ
ncbi:MAG TPA: metal-dependent hydrolase, partial [Dermatophilaceae bacterium]